MRECKKVITKQKDEIRRLMRYEAFFEKQKAKKYRNCGCQIGNLSGKPVRDYSAKDRKQSGKVITTRVQKSDRPVMKDVGAMISP